MTRLFFGALFALSLAACADNSEEPPQPEAVEAQECAIVNPDGSCACEEVDENGDCVEGGGSGVIIQGASDDD